MNKGIYLFWDQDAIYLENHMDSKEQHFIFVWFYAISFLKKEIAYLILYTIRPSKLIYVHLINIFKCQALGTVSTFVALSQSPIWA
jgi:hypothetical protein